MQTCIPEPKGQKENSEQWTINYIGWINLVSEHGLQFYHLLELQLQGRSLWGAAWLPCNSTDAHRMRGVVYPFSKCNSRRGSCKYLAKICHTLTSSDSREMEGLLLPPTSGPSLRLLLLPTWLYNLIRSRKRYWSGHQAKRKHTRTYTLATSSVIVARFVVFDRWVVGWVGEWQWEWGWERVGNA